MHLHGAGTSCGESLQILEGVVDQRTGYPRIDRESVWFVPVVLKFSFVLGHIEILVREELTPSAVVLEQGVVEPADLGQELNLAWNKFPGSYCCLHEISHRIAYCIGHHLWWRTMKTCTRVHAHDFQPMISKFFIDLNEGTFGACDVICNESID